MSTVTCNINAVPVTVPEGTSILDAAGAAGIHIPSLCYLKNINCVGSCRMCLVEIRGRASLSTACTTPVESGMEIQTSTPEIERIRLQNLQLICSDHRQDCSRCTRFPYCELHTLCREYGVDDRKNMFNRKEEISDSLVHLVRDQSKCVQCRRCVSMCGEIQGIHAIQVIGQGMGTKVVSVPDAENICVNCGQCIAVCPTEALTEKNECRRVGVALAQRKKHVIAVLTKEAMAQLGEHFGAPIDAEASAGKTVSALRRLGFRAVFSAEPFYKQFSQALYAEVLRHGQSGTLPVISTRCPSIRKYCNLHFPELQEHISALESPLQTAAKLCSQFYAEKHGLDQNEIFVVTISSCTADKYEQSLPEYRATIYAALTSHEVFLLFERACVSSFSAHQVWNELPEEDCEFLPDMAAVTRSAADASIRTVSASGLKDVGMLFRDIKNGTDYDLLELRACPGGCINGAGRSRKSNRFQTPPQPSTKDSE